LLIIKKNKAKRKTIYCGERGNKIATQAIPPPPPPNGDFGARTREFSEKPLELWKKEADLRKKWRI
jgi:hypothetical protein